MAEQNNSTNTLEQLINQNPLIKSGVKKVQKVQDQQIDEAVSQGVSTQDILKQLMEIASVEQPIAGTMQGPFTAIGGLLQGKGYHPFAPHTQPLGIDTAAKVMGLQQSAEKQPYEVAKLQGEVANQPLDAYKKAVDTMNALIDLQIKQNPELSAQIKSKEAEATAMGTEKGKKTVAKEELSNFLESDYFPIADAVPMGSGVKRYTTGMTSLVKGAFGGVEGALIQSLNGQNAQLKLRLAKRAGDVGNISVVEQAAQAGLVRNVFDTPESWDVKKAILQDLNKAYDDGNSSSVKKFIKKWMESDVYKEQYGDAQIKLQKAIELRKQYPDMSREEIMNRVNNPKNNGKK